MTIVNRKSLTDFDPADLVSFTVMIDRLAELCKSTQRAWFPDKYVRLQADPSAEMPRGYCLLPFTQYLDKLGFLG